MTKARVASRGRQIANALADLDNAYDVLPKGVERRKLAIEVTRTFDVLATETGDHVSRALLRRIATHYSQRALI